MILSKERANIKYGVKFLLNIIFSLIIIENIHIFYSYATVYTMFPVFSLVLDKDVSSKTALTYPELYKELSKGRSLSFKTFFSWVLISIFQGFSL